MSTSTPNPSAAERELMTTADVHDASNIATATLRYWRHASVGPPSFRLGGKVFYRRSAVMAWIQAQEAATTRGDATAAVAPVVESDGPQ